jgi:hypothetical protein
MDAFNDTIGFQQLKITDGSYHRAVVARAKNYPVIQFQSVRQAAHDLIFTKLTQFHRLAKNT